MSLNLSKQSALIDAEKMKNWTIHIFGLGSIGSHLGKALAKTGFENIVGYDMDIVEEDNIPAQAFGLKHIDMKKTDAFVQLLEEETGIVPIVHEGEVTKDTEIPYEPNTIYFCAFDSIPARKLVWDKLKGFPVVWGETRIGRFDERYYFVVPDTTPNDWKDEYEKTLDPTLPMSELKCGEKCSYGPNTDLVSRVLRQMLNIVEGKLLTYFFIGNWETPDDSIIRLAEGEDVKDEEEEFDDGDFKVIEELVEVDEKDETTLTPVNEEIKKDTV